MISNRTSLYICMSFWTFSCWQILKMVPLTEMTIPILCFLPMTTGQIYREKLWKHTWNTTEKRSVKVNVVGINTILMHNLVMPRHQIVHLRTFGCIQWEFDWFYGRSKARCYPFNLDEHQFWGENPQWNAWDILYDIICDVHYDVKMQL